MSNFLEHEAVSDYLNAHISDIPEYLNDLEDETHRKALRSVMISGAVQGRFLAFISQLNKPKRILEIGTYTGYSALCLAEGLHTSGRLDTLEVNDELSYYHDKYFAKSPYGSQLNVHYGDAKSLLLDFPKDSFDLIFLDADKRSYPEYLKLLTPLLSVGGLLLVDNVMWYDKVVDDTIIDEETSAIRRFNSMIKNDARYTSFILPVRDGITIAQKKEA